MVDTQFTDALASKAPTPGGGGASAYAGALAAALGSMVVNLTMGKPKFAAVEGELRMTMDKLEMCRAELLGLIDEDARAFSALAASWKLPKDTPRKAEKRHAAEQAALSGACEVPLQIMRICAKVIELDEFLAHNGSRLALSDVGASAIIAKGALRAAALNVYINTNLMDDVALAASYEREAVDLAKAFGYQADVVYDHVRHEITRK